MYFVKKGKTIDQIFNGMSVYLMQIKQLIMT